MEYVVLLYAGIYLGALLCEHREQKSDADIRIDIDILLIAAELATEHHSPSQFRR